jgi:hypothetical protein
MTFMLSGDCGYHLFGRWNTADTVACERDGTKVLDEKVRSQSRLASGQPRLILPLKIWELLLYS